MRWINTFKLVPIFFLGACVMPAVGIREINMCEMTPTSQTFDIISKNKTSNKSIAIGEIIVEKGAGSITPITKEQYQESIIFSLRQVGWYADKNNAKYILDAHLTKVEQPLIGFDITVKTTAKYILRRKSSGKIVRRETLVLPCTKQFEGSFSDDSRIRMATACAISENTTHLMKVLSTRE